MSLPLKSHLRARAIAAVCGAVVALVAFFVFRTQLGPAGDGFFIPVVLAGGAYFTQMMFSLVVPADCPRCGEGRAISAQKNLAVYMCKACGAETNALEVGTGMNGDAVAAKFAAATGAPPPSSTGAEEEKASRFAKIFIGVGVLCIGIAAFLGQIPLGCCLGACPRTGRFRG